MIKGFAGTTQCNTRLQAVNFKAHSGKTHIETLVELVAETAAISNNDFRINRTVVQTYWSTQVDIQIFERQSQQGTLLQVLEGFEGGFSFLFSNSIEKL
jgi:hypothetical protein